MKKPSTPVKAATSDEAQVAKVPSGDETVDGCVEAALRGEGPKRHTFAAAFIASLVTVLVLIVAVNWLGNGSWCFVSPLCPSIKDRAWKTRRLDQLVRAEGAPQILILGSSRVMQMRPDLVSALTGKRTFNYAVINGNVIDCLAQFHYALKIGAKPEILIFDMTGFDLSIAETQYYLAGHRGLAAVIPPPEKLQLAADILKNEINIRNTVRSIRALAGVSINGPLKDREFLRDGEIIILKDGYRFNSKLATAKASGHFDLSAVLKNRIEQKRIDGLQSEVGALPPSPRWLELFRELLSTAKSAGVEVDVITTPVQPEYEAIFPVAERRAAHEQLIRVLQSECSRYGFHFRDFADLASFGGDPNEFWDHVHQAPPNMTRMTSALFGVNPGATIAPLPTDVERLQQLP